MAMTPERAAQILGISVNATEQEIRKAYRKLVLKWHPDHNQDNEDQANRMIKLVIEAYNVMCKYRQNTASNQNTTNQQNTGTGANTNNTNYNNTNNNNSNYTNNNNNSSSNNNNNRYNNNTDAVRAAWTKLQQAMQEYEAAKTDYATAQANKEAAWAKLEAAREAQFREAYGSPEYNRKKEYTAKMREIWQRALEVASDCSNKMYQAKTKTVLCQINYINLINGNFGGFKSAGFAYQRCA